MVDSEDYQAKMMFKGIDIYVDETPVFVSCTGKAGRSGLGWPFLVFLVLS